MANLDTTITLNQHDETSPGMATSALTLAMGYLDGSIPTDDAEGVALVIRDLANLRDKIIDARSGR